MLIQHCVLSFVLVGGAGTLHIHDMQWDVLGYLTMYLVRGCLFLLVQGFLSLGLRFIMLHAIPVTVPLVLECLLSLCMNFACHVVTEQKFPMFVPMRLTARALTACCHDRLLQHSNYNCWQLHKWCLTSGVWIEYR
jgi:hypothetical protein